MAEEARFISGERIYLRGVRESDVDSRYVSWMNDRDVTRFLESGVFPNSAESLRRYVAQQGANNSTLFLAIVLKDGDRHIGNIKLGPISWIHRAGDIGLLIGEKDCWGKGYASEAIDLIARYAFDWLNLHKVTAGSYVTNVGSIKAFKRAGFLIEATLKDSVWHDGQYMDHILMARMRPK